MTDKMSLEVLKDLSGILWPQTPDEIATLTEALQVDGCRDPVLYWEHDGKKKVIDGATRLQLCQKLGIPFPTKEMQFKDEQGAVEWIIRNQLGRRNISEIQRNILRGMLRIKREADLQPDSGADQQSSLEDDGMRVRRLHSLTSQVAEETGTSKRQVRRDVTVTKSLMKLKEKSPPLFDAAVRGAIGKQDAVAAADAPAEVLTGIAESPEKDWKGSVHAVAEQVRSQKPADAVSGRVPIKLPAMIALDRALSAIVRLKTAATTDCGGWAKTFDDRMREHLNGVFDVWVEWKQESFRRDK